MESSSIYWFINTTWISSPILEDMGEEYLWIAIIMKHHQLHGGTSWTFIEPSYQHLFDNVVDELVENGVNIQFNANVFSVEKCEMEHSNQISYEKNGDLNTTNYDYVLSLPTKQCITIFKWNDFSIRYDLYNSQYTTICTAQGTVFGNIGNIEQPTFWDRDAALCHILIF